MLAVAVLMALSAQSSEIVLNERFLPDAVHTTITAQCGSETVLLRIENRQGLVGDRVTEIVIGDAKLSDLDLARLAAAINSRDIVSAAIVRCGVRANLDKVEIVIDCGEISGESSAPRFIGVTITEDSVEIDST